MGVYIKDMERPGRCDECPLQDYYECDAKLRDTYCPLIPVPPHGRLGDLGRIERTLHEWESVVWDRNAVQMLRDCINLVKAAPTIIPAEPGEEGTE